MRAHSRIICSIIVIAKSAVLPLPPLTHRLRGGSHRFYFSMRQRIAGGLASVAPPPKNPPLGIHHERSDRHFPLFCGLTPQ
jgi:hypothetical protein